MARLAVLVISPNMADLAAAFKRGAMAVGKAPRHCRLLLLLLTRRTMMVFWIVGVSSHQGAFIPFSRRFFPKAFLTA